MKIKIKKVVLVISFFLILFGIAIRLDVKSRPLQFDEGAYSYAALEILYGDREYLDLLDDKPIGTFYLYLFFIKIFGNFYYTFHLISALSDIINIFLILLISLKLFNYRLSLLSTAIYSVMFIPFTMSYSGFLEQPMMVFTLISAYLYMISLDEKSRFRNFFLVLSGIFSAVSFHIKQPGIIILFAFFVHQAYLMYYRKIKFKQMAYTLIFVILGFTIITVPLYIFFISKGIFNRYIYAIFFYSLDYGDLINKNIQFIKHFLFLMPFLSILTIISSFFNLKRRNMKFSFIFIYFILVILFFTATTDFQAHYLTQIIPFMILISVYLLKNLYHIPNFARKIVVLFFLCLFFYNLLYTLTDFIKNDPNIIEKTSSEMAERLSIFGDLKFKLFDSDHKAPFTLMDNYHDYNNVYTLGHQLEIANYISNRLNKSDKVLSTHLGFLYFLNRTNNYKIHYFTPMFFSKFDISDIPSYASESKYFIYVNYQEDRGWLSKNFLDCIKEHWNSIDEISNWYVKVYENTNRTACKSVW